MAWAWHVLCESNQKIASKTDEKALFTLVCGPKTPLRYSFRVEPCSDSFSIQFLEANDVEMCLIGDPLLGHNLDGKRRLPCKWYYKKDSRDTGAGSKGVLCVKRSSLLSEFSSQVFRPRLIHDLPEFLNFNSTFLRFSCKSRYFWRVEWFYKGFRQRFLNFIEFSARKWLRNHFLRSWEKN